MKPYKNLRSCSADVLTNQDYCHFMFRNTDTGEVFETNPGDRWFVLRSYASVVCVLNECGDLCFKLPRCKYSVTTQSHVRKFLEDYAVPDVEFEYVTDFAEITNDGSIPMFESREWRRY